MNRRERVIRRVVAWIVTLLYRRVEVRQIHGLTSKGPQLANASHFGGFTDPLLLLRAMDRPPRFIARDVIWKFPVVRNVLDWVGAIPVHKSDDGGPTSNDEMFKSTYDALAAHDLVTIFPEGITVDDPRIAHIKTGSARIALGARAAGVEGITLLSAGIHYENKAALRSSVFIDIGYPIDLDAWVADNIATEEPQDASNREAVVALTSEMERRLRWAAPDFDDWTTARNLSSASAIALRPVDGSEPEVGYGDAEVLARLLDSAGAMERRLVVDSMERYQSELDAIGCGDETFVSSLRRKRAFFWNTVKDLFVGALLLPFAVVGIIVNAIPMVAIWLIGRLKVADAMMATLKPIGGILAFGVTWAYWLWWGWSYGGAGILAAGIVLLPFYLFALIALVERTVLLIGAVRSFSRSRSIADAHDQMHADRRAVVEAVAQAL